MSVPMTNQITKTSKILSRFIIAILCAIASVLLIILDPIHSIVNYNLRLETGSALYNLLRHDIKAARLSLFMFNITNAEKFMSGEDKKMKVKEVGPFVYQEYRWFEDMEMNDNGTEMGMTPKMRSEFLPDESIGDPKNINLTFLNLPLLTTTSLLSPYPSFIRFMFSAMTSQMKSKAIINMDVHSLMWGYENPIITLCNKLISGLIYFDRIGFLDRFYDKESDYRIVVGATKQDRFKIKSVTKYRHLQQGSMNDLEVSELTFPDTYEGIGYPPELTPEVPIHWYRLSICWTFALQYKGSKTTEYGGEGLQYTLSNSSFINETNPATKKTFPKGIMDISKCYYGMPFVASYPHFLDGDPKLLEAVDGLMPDRKKYPNDIIIDRRAGIPFYTKLSLQLNIAIDDVSYSMEARRFSNKILPVLRLEVVS
ncbi:unnamed protein product [Arctia plantaginis]|uniref:Scavenger receptor class B member 1 n=1 Tax=Arctia plantaginis TaxID=874455 RepID=A0A8S0Z355_ARCPL|nr:unnamed protein product [Arctia plantaginis]